MTYDDQFLILMRKKRKEERKEDIQSIERNNTKYCYIKSNINIIGSYIMQIVMEDKVYSYCRISAIFLVLARRQYKLT